MPRIFPDLMDFNYILFIVAILNFGGDLYNSWKYRARLPKWIPSTVVGCFLVCLLSWWIAPDVAGFFSASVLAVYLLIMRSFSRKTTGPRPAKPVTWCLVAACCAGFCVQLYHNATFDMERIVALGALYSPLFEQGEWWRLLSAQFLHLGILHLACNMLGLVFLGPLVERAYGALVYVTGYFVSGMGGMLLAMCLYELDVSANPVVLVGASANVLGLVGLTAASALMRYRESKSAYAKAQLGTMAQIVLLQIVFDALVPEVSSIAHLGGAITGFVFGLLVHVVARKNLADLAT